MNKQINLAWTLPIFMLSLSFFHLPYGYYTLLRIIVTGCAGYLAHLEYVLNKNLSIYFSLLIFLAVLFNPIIPIHFSKSIWGGLDIFAVIIFGLHAVVFNSKKN
jgi:hypothetical protein